MGAAADGRLGRCAASSGRPRHRVGWALVAIVTSGIDAKRLVRDLLAHDAFGVAASVAFWFFLSLIPLLVLAGFLIGQVARARGMDALTGPLLDIVPGSAEELVRGEIVRLAGSRTSSIAPLGALGFFWTASSGLHNLMDVIEVAVDARRQAWWWKRTMALAWVIVGLTTACVLAVVLVQVDSRSQASTPTPTPTPTPTSTSTSTSTPTPSVLPRPSPKPPVAPAKSPGSATGAVRAVKPPPASADPGY